MVLTSSDSIQLRASPLGFRARSHPSQRTAYLSFALGALGLWLGSVSGFSITAPGSLGRVEHGFQRLHPLGAADIDRSFISSIRSQNLAGIVSTQTQNRISLEMGQGLIAVTGETGSGKSLFVARVMEIVSGARTSAILFGKKNDAKASEPVTVEMDLHLTGEYWKRAELALADIGIDVACFEGNVSLQRTLLMQPNGRIRSTCFINQHQVTLKTMASFCQPLFTVVDAASAAASLSKPEARLAIIDSAVASELLRDLQVAKQRYNRARRKREKLEKELSQRVLPASFPTSDDGSNMDAMNHWIKELDAFQSRMSSFCEAVVAIQAESSNSLKPLEKLLSIEWENDDENEMYDSLVGMRDMLVSLDSQFIAANSARECLGSLSTESSAATAIERARSHIMDSFGSGHYVGSSMEKIEEATERAHELLNELEAALSACTRFIEDDERGLMRTLEVARETCPITAEEVESLLLDWSSLARKHGIPPNSLPLCHKSLRQERDGTVEAKEQLPIAKEEEEQKLAAFRSIADVVREERTKLAQHLSQSVTAHLPSLGMDRSTFVAVVADNNGQGESDIVDFHLSHEECRAEEHGPVGLLHEVASAGERARILLSIECTIPGAIASSSSQTIKVQGRTDSLPPIAIVYDEIDAHVGGRAAVAVGSMLVEQSLRSQIIAITHSASIAAAADAHAVVERAIVTSDGRRQVAVNARSVGDHERKRELARMASGDMASKEAEVFAEALIKDALKLRRKRSNKSLST